MGTPNQVILRAYFNVTFNIRANSPWRIQPGMDINLLWQLDFSLLPEV
jgi:hypothetical protein